MGREELVPSLKGTQMSVYQNNLKRNEPAVITEALIQEAYQDTLPKGDAGRVSFHSKKMKNYKFSDSKLKKFEKI